MALAMESLDRVRPWQLDKFHSDYLQPNEEFLQNVRVSIDSICDCLKESSFQETPLRRVKVVKGVKGGSLEKGTSMKNGSDADLVLFLNNFKSYTDLKKYQKKIIKEIKRWLDEWQEKFLNTKVFFEKSKWSNPWLLQFEFCSKESDNSIGFDVLLAYDALGQYDSSRPDPQIYLDRICKGKSGEFSPCFTELQKDFIVDRPTKLKNLIRLVKYWYKEVEEKPFPPKYALELLTVYAWEKGSGQDEFNTAEGFRTVLWLIEHYKEICIYWIKYHDFDNEIIKQYLQLQLCKRPVILDPADPTTNFGEAKGWDRLAREAKLYADMNCCRNRDGSFVQPWNVPTNSARYQMIDTDRYTAESSFHPSMLPVPREQGRFSCSIL